MIVNGADLNIIKEYAASAEDYDANWTTATVLDLGAGISIQPDYRNFRWEIRISGPTPGSPDAAFVKYTAIAGNFVDDVGAALVPLLIAQPNITSASYTAASNTLFCTGGADNLGDRTLSVSVFIPTCKRPIASMVGTIVHQGAPGAILSVVLLQPARIPEIQRRL